MEKFEGSYSADHNVRTLDRKAHWLTFRSHPICATVGIGASQGFKFEEFLVTETLKDEPGDGSDSRRSYYQITFAYSVSNEANIDHAFTRFRALRSAIEAVWHYAFGVPYDRNLTHSADSLAVEGWADNRLDVLSSRS